jgi:K+-sensing histidine kinase KdpD
MFGISSSRSRSAANSVAKPYLRPVDSCRAPDESPGAAVMACLTASRPGNGELLRKAHRAAREKGDRLYAVFFDSPRARIGRAEVRTLIDDAVLASCFGAKIVWLESADTVSELLAVARRSHVGRIFVSRDQPAPFSRLFGRAVYSDLLSRGEGFRIDVVGFEAATRAH